jgi:hypothetical protein
MEGLSARSIMINAFCQLVIFLYLLDNETSMVVLASSGIGMAIEFWKVTKAMEVGGLVVGVVLVVLVLVVLGWSGVVVVVVVGCWGGWGG